MDSRIEIAGQPSLVEPIQPHDHATGPADAPVEMIEFGDFECPFTRRAHAGIERLRRDMGDRFRFAWRHMPLREIHPHADLLAQASEAAAAQGRFWEMREILWRNFGSFERADLRRYADELGLDVVRFDAELDSGQHAARVMHDEEVGIESGVRGTPTVFVAGVRYEGEAQDATFLRRRIEQAAANAR